MTVIEFIQAGLAVVTVAGIGGLWFRLGQAIESNNNTHKKLDGLSGRVRTLEQRAWRMET